MEKMESGGNQKIKQEQQQQVNTFVFAENLQQNGNDLNQTKNEGKKSKSTFWTKYRGMTLSIIASMFFSITFLIVKNLQHYQPISVSVWRHVAILIPTIPLVLFFQLRSSASSPNIFASIFPISNRERAVLAIGVVLRGIVGATALLLQVLSLKYLSIGDSAIFTFSAPVFVVIFACLCIGEKCGVVSVLVTLLTLVGVGLIVRPPIITGGAALDMDNLKGVVLGLLSTLLNSIVIVILRKIRTVHWVFILLAFGALGVIENLIVALCLGVLQLPSGLVDCLLVFLALPTTVYSAQMSLILALKYEEAGPVALVGTSGILFSFLLQIIFFGVMPDGLSIAGGTIVILGVGITTCRKWAAGQPPEQDGKKRPLTFRLLLL